MFTPKQKRVLDFITGYREENGFSPSQHEIAKNFGFTSLGTVQNYLVRLEKQGLLTKSWNARRGVTTPQPHSLSSEAVPLPLSGRVAAGKPIEAIEVSETFDVPSRMISKGRRAKSFVLRVEGDSMIDDGILDGDYVVIAKQDTAENGQTVVALVSGEATIKRYYRRKDYIELVAANSKYKPIRVDAGQEFRIEGVLSGVLRVFN